MALSVSGLLALAAAPPDAGALPPKENTIRIMIDTSVKNQITAHGFYETQGPTVSLTGVTVWCFPASGGVMPPQKTTKDIDAQKGKWGLKGNCVIDTHVYKGQYAVRADGTFSDGSVRSSGYVVQHVDGDGPTPAATFTLDWGTGFPKSTRSKTISVQGSFTGDMNKKMAGSVIAFPVEGGKLSSGDLKADPAKGTWTAADIAVDTATGYSVTAWAADNAPKPLCYCAPFAVTRVMPLHQNTRAATNSKPLSIR